MRGVGEATRNEWVDCGDDPGIFATIGVSNEDATGDSSTAGVSAGVLVRQSMASAVVPYKRSLGSETSVCSLP